MGTPRPHTFWRYIDRITRREVKMVTNFDVCALGNSQAEIDASMVEWVSTYFRNAEYIAGSAERFDPAIHSNGAFYPVPIQNVLWNCRTPAVYAPPPKRVSVFISRPVIKPSVKKLVLSDYSD